MSAPAGSLPAPSPLSHISTLIRTLPLLVLLASPLLAAPAQAASFSCDKAETPDEMAICKTLSLNDRDVEMATRFEILKEVLPMGGRTKMQEDQEAWLKERRTCAADVGYLRDLYDARLKTLRGLVSEFAKQGQ